MLRLSAPTGVGLEQFYGAYKQVASIKTTVMTREQLKTILTVIILIFPFVGKSQINYGSNNGKYLTIRGTKVYYEEYGYGMPLILLHGGFGNIADFKKCIPELSKKYNVIIPDAPGLGRSEHADSLMSYRLMSNYYS